MKSEETRSHQPTPTVGQVMKKIMTINPDLTAQQLIQVMKASIQVRGGYFQDGFAK